MEVRCDRCRARYVFADVQVGEEGVPVRCSCGHVFRVKKKAVVVTVAVKQDELTTIAPIPAGDLDRAGAAPASPVPERGGAEGAAGFRVCRRGGEIREFKDLSALQKWIVEGHALRDDEVSERGQPWQRLREHAELLPFFAVVDRARQSETALRPRVAATLIDFPAVEAHRLPGAATAAAEPAFASAPAAEAGGPVLPGNLGPPPKESSESWEQSVAPAPASSSEPAWAAEAKVVRTRRVGPAATNGKRRRSLVPMVALALSGLALAAGVAAYLFWPTLLPALPPALLSFLGESEHRAVESQPPAPGSEALGSSPSSSAGAPVPGPGATEAPGSRSTSTPSAGQAAAGATKPAAAATQTPTAADATTVATTTRTATPAATAPVTPRATVTQTPAPTPGATATPAPTSAATPGATATPTPAPTPAATETPTEGEPEAEAEAPAADEAPSAPATPTATETKAASPPSATASAPSPIPSPSAAPDASTLAERPPRAHPARIAKSEAPSATAARTRRSELESPRRIRPLLARAKRLRQLGRASAALDVYAQAVTLEPENAVALAGRGLCYLDLSNYAQAEASFKSALKADGHNADALMGLAETYRYEGRRGEAVNYYDRYLAAHPDGEDAVAARNAIRALKE